MTVNLLDIVGEFISLFLKRNSRALNILPLYFSNAENVNSHRNFGTEFLYSTCSAVFSQITKFAVLAFTF